MLLSQNSFAQDGLPPQYFQEPTNQELNLNEDKPLLYEQNESRSSRSILSYTSQRDSLITTSAKQHASKKARAENKEDDALSFNFLYYIIQKYKISDIVDQ